jgi:hypothetical protein
MLPIFRRLVKTIFSSASISPATSFWMASTVFFPVHWLQLLELDADGRSSH